MYHLRQAERLCNLPATLYGLGGIVTEQAGFHLLTCKFACVGAAGCGEAAERARQGGARHIGHAPRPVGRQPQPEAGLQLRLLIRPQPVWALPIKAPGKDPLHRDALVPSEHQQRGDMRGAAAAAASVIGGFMCICSGRHGCPCLFWGGSWRQHCVDFLWSAVAGP